MLNQKTKIQRKKEHLPDESNHRDIEWIWTKKEKKIEYNLTRLAFSLISLGVSFRYQLHDAFSIDVM